ncbi:MAG: hypothetical protein AB7G17_14110 [Phycisphaerales bacterium]
MKWARWDSGRHSLTIVSDGSTRTVRADLSPSFTVKFTPPVDGTPPVAVYLFYADDTAMQYADSTAMEYA